MGGLVAKAVDQNMKKNQEFMLEVNRITMERQIQMQNQMRERMAAMQIARSRELLNWFGSFYTIAAVGMVTGYRRSKNTGLLVPLLPLTFILGYQMDLSYGGKLNRIRSEAESIIQYEKDLLEMPMHLPTLSSIDIAREEQKKERMIHSSPVV